MELMVNSQGSQTSINISTSEVPVINQTQDSNVQNENVDNKNSKSYTKEELSRAVNKLNRFLDDEETHAEYSYYKDLNTTMIKIVDDKTGKTVLEIPPEKILDMVAMLCKAAGVLVDKKA